MADPNFKPAAAQVALALQDHFKVQYAFMGGTACALLGSPRERKDVDLIIIGDADKVSKDMSKLPGFTTVKEPLVGDLPAVIGGPNKYPIDIFDAESWPNRPQYKITKHNTVTVEAVHSNGKKVQIQLFYPPWLVREKIASLAERGGAPRSPKSLSDQDDLRFLCKILQPGQKKVQELDFTNQPVYKEYYKTVLGRQDVAQDLKKLLSECIKA